MIRRSFTLLFFVWGSLAHAQESKDSVSVVPRIPTIIRSNTENDYTNHATVSAAPDTSVSRLHHVFITDSGDRVHLGNAGSALTSLWFAPLRGPTTTLGLQAYAAYGSGPEEQAYYNTNKRYSRIDFWQGAFRESGIRFLHTQNVNRNLNLGLSIERFTVKEFLPDGDTYFNRIACFGSYESPNRRYRLFGHTSWMRIRNQVNGGLSNDSAFLAGAVDNLGLKGAAVRLADADQRVRRRELYLSQYYNFGKLSASDTTHFHWRVGLRTRYRRDSFTYLDNAADSSYYADFFLNTATSYDSSLTDQLTNRFMLERQFTLGESGFLRAAASVEDQRVGYYQGTSTGDWSNQLAGLEARLGLDSGRVVVALNASRVISGQDQDNQVLAASVRGTLREKIQWHLGLERAESAVPLIYRAYSGNHLRWTRDFDSQTLQQATIGLALPDWKFGLTGHALSIDRYLYIGYQATPEQADESIQGIQVELNKEFRLGKWGLDNRIRYQSFTDADRIRLPDFILQHTLFFEDVLFNKALVLRAGLDAWYCDAWNGAAFSPSTSLYYLQKQVETGGYLRTDLILNLKIKTAGLFLRFTNLTDGIPEKAYALVPGYPQPGRVFHFGVRWMFFDQ